MSTIVFRLDITQIFCDVDDFCHQWSNLWRQVPQLPSTMGEKRSKSRMHLSEVMTIVIAFHGMMAGLAAYTYLPKKPSIDIYPKDLPALPPAIF